jgi:hypothetical protein
LSKVAGNYVDGVAIAGQVQIAQFSLEANSGMIKSLDNDGKITLEGGQVVRINDPNAVFSAGYKAQPEFTADDVNPSVTGKPSTSTTLPSGFADTSIAFSGFPMCVPRSSADPKCPSTNRPAGRTSFNAPDPLTMAPLLPGDYIEFEGIKVGGEIIAYGMVAPSVQILTPSGPTYLRVEEAIIGIFDTQNNGVVEFADSRVIGYSSTPGVSVTISRMEIDPCTGETNDVSVGTATPTGARLKWTWRSGSSSLIKYAREYKATASTGTKETNGGQIIAGQYVAPIAEWIFPELTSPGAFPGKLDFSQMTNLRDGIGPDSNGNVWGPLNPWPDTSAPAPFKTCDATTPTTPTTPSDAPTAQPSVNAGVDQKVRPGVVVSLAGKVDNAASFPSGDLTYSWVQIDSGAKVTLTGASAATATFTVPSATAVANYTFELTVKSKSAGTSSNDTIVVSNDPKGADSVTVTSYTWTSQQGGTISVSAQSNVVDGSAKLTIQLMNPNAGAVLTMVDAKKGQYTYTARSTKQPSGGVRVTSNLGGVGNKTTLSQKLKRWHARFFGTA